MSDKITENWKEILNKLKENYDVSGIIISTWIEPLTVAYIRDNTVYFCVDDSLGTYGIEYLHKKNYDVRLLSSIREFFNDPDINIKIDTKSNLFIDEDSEQIMDISASESPILKEALKRSNLNSKYTFDNFVVGEGNRHAYATCMAIADLPGQDSFNPLFLYGGPGLGKTHLIQSIGHFILENNPKVHVLYVTAESFTNEIIKAIKSNKTNEFREKYRQNDVLIIDDIQEIIGKESTQQEFFNTFNYLYEVKKQVIISSDRPPKEFTELDERLRSRFDWGVPIDIHAPDYETRMAILKNKAEIDGLTNIDEKVFDYIATNIISNVRELEGALHKLRVYSNLGNMNITLDLAKDSLRDLISQKTETAVTSETILDVVSEHLEIPVSDIISSKRSKDIAIARQLVMYLCRELTDKSLQAIGDSVGGKDHATVCNGIKRTEEKMDSDPIFKNTVHVIINKINPEHTF